MTVTSKLLARRINPRVAYPLRRHGVDSICEVLQHPVKNFGTPGSIISETPGAEEILGDP